MAVRIRLRRTGKRNAPSHRIVVTDSRSPRDGRFIEILGTYNPSRKQETIDLERADHWLSHGAKPSETVDAIIKRARAGVSFGGAAQPKAPPAAETTDTAAAEEPAGNEAAPAGSPQADAEANTEQPEPSTDTAAAAEQDDQEKLG